MNVKGDLKLEIDELGIEARVTITPDENGAELSDESIEAQLSINGVVQGIHTEEILKALRTLLRKGDEPVSFIAASGTPPTPAVPEEVQFEACKIPPRLGLTARLVLSEAPAPEVFRIRQERVKKPAAARKRHGFSFLSPKEEPHAEWEVRTVREKVEVDPSIKGTGYVEEGAVVARIAPGQPGKDGRSIFGRPVPSARTQGSLLLGSGLERNRGELVALYTGFLRKGGGWCDVVPFRDHVVKVVASKDRQTCLLSFSPGDRKAPPSDCPEILAQAGELGMDTHKLISAAEIEKLLDRAIDRGQVLEDVPISIAMDALAEVSISPDKLSATLSLRKGRGGGKPLTLSAISEAIKASEVRGFDADEVKKDIMQFFTGPQAELNDYALATGKPPARGQDSSFIWSVGFLPLDEAQGIRAVSARNAASIGDLPSLAGFPLESVVSIARVSRDAEVAKIVPAGEGKAGVDVFGRSIPAEHGEEMDLGIFEGLRRQGQSLVASTGGILEMGGEGMRVLLRVRPHRDAELRVALSDDRMRATVTYVPGEGTGKPLDSMALAAGIAGAGIAQGIIEDRLRQVEESIEKDLPIIDVLIAEGKSPEENPVARIVYNARIATGRAVTVSEDGKADFRAQDKITQVKAGDVLATLLPSNKNPANGWDVTGRVIPAGSGGGEETLKAGRLVKTTDEPDGSIRFSAVRDGELKLDGGLIDVVEVHTVTGDVDMESGNVRFPGAVRVMGSVQSGFSVVAAGDIEVQEVVQAALVSTEGAVVVGQGIKGEGKAIIRAGKSITAPFAELATLLSMGDVRLKSGCLRCQVKCAGTFYLDSEKGNLMGGKVRTRRGAAMQNLGSPSGARTDLSFGQDYVLKDKIEVEEKEVQRLRARVAEIDLTMKRLEKRGTQAAKALETARAEKRDTLKLIEQRRLRLISMHDTFDEHVASELVVRGTLYPGVVVESHGRLYETKTERTNVRLYFDPVKGKIMERLPI